MAADRIRITLDKERVLWYRNRDIRDLENALQKDPQDWIAPLFRGSSKTLGLCLLHGFRHADSQLRENAVLDMLDTYIDNGGDIQVIRERVAEALMSTGLWGPDALETYRAEVARIRRGPQGNGGDAASGAG